MKQLAALLLLTLNVFSFSVVGATQSPQVLVKQVADQLLERIDKEQQRIEEDPGYIYRLVDQMVLPYFDFAYMSQLVLAKNWRKAAGDQRRAFTQEFRLLLVRTYATSLKEYSDQTINYLPLRSKADDKKVTVKTEIDQPGGFPISIDYRLRLKDGEWKVFDVIIEEVSLVTNYRSSFARQIRKEGINQLITTLAKRNRKATGE